MSTLMPTDAQSHPIPALRLMPDRAYAVAATATSSRNSQPFAPDTRVITIYATGPVFVRTGDASVTASTSDHFFPEGVYSALSLGGDYRDRHDYISVIRAESDCVLYVSEME